MKVGSLRNSRVKVYKRLAKAAAAARPVVESLEQRQLLSAGPVITTTTPSTFTLGPSHNVLTDTAVLSNGNSPTGSIVFSLNGPEGYSATQTETVTGNGAYVGSIALGTDGSPGNYVWTVAYSGDANNAAAAGNDDSISQFDATLPTQGTETLSIPSGTPQASYFSAALSSAGVLNGSYEDYSVSTAEAPVLNAALTAKVFSTVGQAIPAGLVNEPQNLNEVNYILNQYYVGTSGPTAVPYTFSDVQMAIWTLVDKNPPDTTGSDIGSFTQANVNNIVSQAEANGKNFIPGQNQWVGVLLDPFTNSSNPSAQVTLARVWNGTPGAQSAEETQVSAPSSSVSVNGLDYLTTPQTTINDSTTGQPIAGTTITLTGIDSSGNQVDVSNTTNANGVYIFNWLNPSNSAGYTVTESEPAGDIHVGQAAAYIPANTAIANVISGLVVSAGEERIDDNFYDALATQTDIQGTVLQIPQGTAPAISDSGIGIYNVEIDLYGTDSVGQFIHLTTTTNSNGQYQFLNLNPSNANGYTVIETPPSAQGYTHVGQASSTPGAYAPSASFSYISTIVLPAGGSSVDNFYENSNVTITGNVELVSVSAWDNPPPNSSPAGPPIAGTTITLSGYDSSGNAVDLTTTTNASGQYTFANLNPSGAYGYTVTETVPTGDEYLGEIGGVTGSVPLSYPAEVYNIVINTGTTTINFYDAAVTPSPITVTGYDYLVPTGTTITSSTTGTPLAGVAIELSGTDSTGGSVYETTTTNASGFYSFSGLNPSNANGYFVSEVYPGDVHLGQTSTTPGAYTPPASSSYVSGIVLACESEQRGQLL